MKALRLAISALLVLGASAAFAQDYSRPGMYAQLNGVASFEAFDNAPSNLFDTGIGVSGRFGYRFNPRLAVEGEVGWSGDFVDCCGVDLTETTVTANGKFFVLTDQIQPYLLWGIGGGFASTNVTSDESGFLVKIGGGVDWYLNERFGLMFEAVYNAGTGDIDDLNYTGLGWGAFYRF